MTTPEIYPEIELTEDDLLPVTPAQGVAIHAPPPRQRMSTREAIAQLVKDLSLPAVPPLPQLGEAVHAPPELPPRTQLPAVPALPAPWEGDYAGYEVVDTPVSRRDQILWAVWPKEVDDHTMDMRLAIVDAALREGGEDSDVVGRILALLEQPLAGPQPGLPTLAPCPAAAPPPRAGRGVTLLGLAFALALLGVFYLCLRFIIALDRGYQP